MAETLFKKMTVESEKSDYPPYPDYIDDSEILLLTILQRLPKNTQILHCLGTICRLRHDSAAATTHYNSILEIEPDDRIALFYLAYIKAAGDGGPSSGGSVSQPVALPLPLGRE